MHTRIRVLMPVLLFAAAAFAQEGHTPTPGPDVKKLDYFAGSWKTQGKMNPGPMGPGGAFSSNDSCEWQQGNFFLICHINFTSAMGNGIELSVMGYDPAQSAYIYTAFNSNGEHQTATGSVAGDTWTWSSTSGAFKWRYTEKIVSPKSMSIKFEGSQDGTNWMTLMEGTSNKQ